MTATTRSGRLHPRAVEFLRYYPPRLLIGRVPCPRCRQWRTVDLLTGRVRPACHGATLAEVWPRLPVPSVVPLYPLDRVHPLAPYWWTRPDVAAVLTSCRCPVCRTWMPVDLLRGTAVCWAETCGAVWTLASLIDRAADRTMRARPRPSGP
ncbi:MAG: hypothetical protein K6V97_03985 [Actinomycetia bacterium]|nr:hypothetical protein [Actinomycetes bacterium]